MKELITVQLTRCQVIFVQKDDNRWDVFTLPLFSRVINLSDDQAVREIKRYLKDDRLQYIIHNKKK